MRLDEPGRPRPFGPGDGEPGGRPEPFDGELLPEAHKAGSGQFPIEPQPYAELEERARPLARELIEELALEPVAGEPEPAERGGKLSVRQYLRETGRLMRGWLFVLTFISLMLADLVVAFAMAQGWPQLPRRRRVGLRAIIMDEDLEGGRAAPSVRRGRFELARLELHRNPLDRTS